MLSRYSPDDGTGWGAGLRQWQKGQRTQTAPLGRYLGLAHGRDRHRRLGVRPGWRPAPLGPAGGACKKLRLIWVDGTYRGPLVEWVAQHMRFLLRVPLRPDGCKGFMLLPRRWVVERTWTGLNQSRRLSKDYKRLPKSREAMIYLSMTRLILRRLTAT